LHIQSGICIIYMYECQRFTLLEFRFSRSKMHSPLDFELPRVNCIYIYSIASFWTTFMITRYISIKLGNIKFSNCSDNGIVLSAFTE
jgi:hypothetical protein